MVDVVQLVRASDCGSECRGFESHLPPKKSPTNLSICRASCLLFIRMIFEKLQENVYRITFTSPFLAILTILEGL